MGSFGLPSDGKSLLSNLINGNVNRHVKGKPLESDGNAGTEKEVPPSGEFTKLVNKRRNKKGDDYRVIKSE